MRSVELGLGNIKVACFYGVEEFEKYARFEQTRTGLEKPELEDACGGMSCIGGIWLRHGDDAAVMAHELIHTLSILHHVLGIKEDEAKECLAYQHTYLMRKFFKADNLKGTSCKKSYSLKSKSA